MNYLKDEIDEGWSVQIYGRDRRLLCSFYPSHGWTFFLGFIFGLLLTFLILGNQLPQSSSTSSSNTPTTSNDREPLLQVD
ncbi:MAG: hypothetical protein ACLFRN_04815 [Halothece sp.]